MSSAYSTAAWANFLVAEVGASAALVGLLFVAVSINLTRILQYPTLPGRAFEALVILAVVLLVATFGLVPGQSARVLGMEVTGTAVGGWGTILFVLVTSPKDPDAPPSWMWTRVVTGQLASVPMIASGVSLLCERGGGLYWMVAGIVGSLLAALLDAWVLLVEIQR